MGRKHPRNGAFTRIELFVVGLILVLLVGVLAPGMIQRKHSAQLAGCVANLKQVMLGELLWIYDGTNNLFSWQHSANRGGTLEYIDRGKVFSHFRALSNELVTPSILICPADNREVAKDFAALADSNLSYFINMDASRYGSGLVSLEKSVLAIVFGDRNVTNNTGPRAGILNVTVSNYASLGWNSRMHNEGRKASQTSIGNITTVDGSIHTVASTNLQEAFRYSVYHDFTNRLAIP